MDIGIFIEYNGQVVQFPVNPSTFNVKTSGNNSTAEIISLGEIVIPKKKKLSSISWDSFFPYESWYPAIRTKGKFESAKFYLDFLDKIREDCKPCHLTVTGIGFDDDVVIDSFDYYHQAGDHEDTYYSITLKKFQPYSVTVIAIDQKEEPQPATPVGTPPVQAEVKPEPKNITIGCEVIVNGSVFYTSYGATPSVALTNFRGKINFLNKDGTHPYHVTNLTGGWMGWAKEESLELV